ncbi:nucleoside-diphosphate-sugar epimerase [Diplodia corticola]|uniref:Nucleoside-diphosphate-sugar epimerase n=1 Tax=Diplodia corticola TaxID=236234 RepID=A0A1J9S4J7_9PEZI|nr:nucleoside-diphosphate-sugar epimerase [Diplodia corticola]OJD34884.1 nucleoside-diphosphate-sugar epimerase [Diplodia corticola]
MHVILTGATGLVGSGALAQILANMKAGGPISRLSILSRKPVPMAEGAPNVTVIQHKDYENYPPELLKQLDGAEACIWAQGVSQFEVGKEEYIKITQDYPVAAAKAFSGLHDPFKFVYVSGEGATHSPGFFTPIFGRIKGATELQLLGLPAAGHPSLAPYAVRPAAVDSAGHAEVIAAQKGRMPVRDYMSAVVGPLFRALPSGYLSPTAMLGDFFIKLAVGDGAPVEGDDVLEGGRIVPNKAFRRIMKQSEGSGR